MSADKLDAMGKTNRLLMPVVGVLFGVVVIGSWLALGQNLLSSPPDNAREWAGVASKACMFGVLVLSSWEFWRKKRVPGWLLWPLWLGWAGGAAFESGGVNGVAWAALALLVAGLIAVVAFRPGSAARFGRAGLE